MSRRTGPLATGLLLSLGSLLVMALLFGLAELTTRWLFPQECLHVSADAANIERSRSFLTPCFTVEGAGDAATLVAPPRPGTGSNEETRLPRRKRDGVRRIVVIGESSADLLARHLAALSEAPSCGGKVEVLNCAQPGSGLEHVERRFDEVLGYQPDAVVLLFGHNIFFRFPLDTTQLGFDALRTRSCLLSELAPVPPAPPPTLAERLDVYETFLRRAAAAARERQIALAVATMPANLRLPPSSGAHEREDAGVLAARFLEARGQRDQAIARLQTLVESGDVPYWHYRLGDQLARAGRDDGHAQRELRRAADEDTLRLRAPSPVNDRIRAVAQDEHLLLRDTEHGLEARAPAGAPGWEAFIDNCHLQPPLLDVEAAAMLALLSNSIALPAACTAARPPEPRGLRDVLNGVFALAAMGPDQLSEVWYEGLALAVESWVGRDRAGADADVAAFLATPELAAARGEPRGTRVLVAIAEGYQRAGWSERALEINEQARQGDRADGWVQLGLFEVARQNQPAARQAFERALALEPGRADATLFLGSL